MRKKLEFLSNLNTSLVLWWSFLNCDFIDLNVYYRFSNISIWRHYLLSLKVGNNLKLLTTSYFCLTLVIEMTAFGFTFWHLIDFAISTTTVGDSRVAILAKDSLYVLKTKISRSNQVFSAKFVCFRTNALSR